MEQKLITEEDVQATYEKARKTGRIDDRVKYATLKRKLEEQTQGE